jgi:hypothetical protein
MNIGKHRVHLSPFQNKKGAAAATPVRAIVIAAQSQLQQLSSFVAVAHAFRYAKALVLALSASATIGL